MIFRYSACVKRHIVVGGEHPIAALAEILIVKGACAVGLCDYTVCLGLGNTQFFNGGGNAVFARSFYIYDYHIVKITQDIAAAFAHNNAGLVIRKLAYDVRLDIENIFVRYKVTAVWLYHGSAGHTFQQCRYLAETQRTDVSENADVTEEMIADSMHEILNRVAKKDKNLGRVE